MKILNLTLVAFIGGIMTWTQPQICAANVPAGTTILVRTTKNILSDDPPGREFEAVVAKDVAVDGKVVIPAGTPVRGIVKSPHFSIAGTSRPLTLRLTGIVIRGRPVAIETEDLQCADNSPWTIGPDRRVRINGDSFIYNAGTFISFRFKQPVIISVADPIRSNRKAKTVVRGTAVKARLGNAREAARRRSVSA